MQSAARPSARPLSQTGLLVLSSLSIAAAIALLGAMAWDKAETNRDVALASMIERHAIPGLTLAHVIPADGDAFSIRLAAPLGTQARTLLHCLPYDGIHAADDTRPPRPDRRLLMPGPALELMIAADAACREGSRLRRQLGDSA